MRRELGAASFGVADLSFLRSRLQNPRQIVVDWVTVAVAAVLTLLMVRNLSGMPASLGLVGAIAACGATLTIVSHAILRGYKGSWRYFTVQDAWFSLGAAASAFAVTVAAFGKALPTSGWALLLGALVSGALMPRVLARVRDSHRRFGLVGPREGYRRRKDDHRQGVLLVGMGERAADFIRSSDRVGSEFRVLGIVPIDGEAADIPPSVRGVPVLGPATRLRGIVDALSEKGERPDTLVLTRDEASARSVGELLALTDRVGVPVAWLPRSDRLDEDSGSSLRPIRLNDLLPRSASLFDSEACGGLMEGATVLVTGAGGSIGSELVRQIAGLGPERLILTELSEHALYLIDQEVRGAFPGLAVTASLLDVRDAEAVRRAMQAHRPNFVFHAAALKHVPIVEGQPCEGVLTNVCGSRAVADAAEEAGADAMVMVSTDKAVNPANVMGATKRLAEAYCQAMDAETAHGRSRTRFVTVRFGNVLGSNGSVVPLFQAQLARGGPLTVTHPEVERFFMTIPEASRLILQALLQGMEDDRGEQGIFVLDMGKPVRIEDLARQVIRLSGLKPDTDVKIVYTGLRPGEKLYEELMHETEDLVSTDHPSLMVARPRFVQIRTVRQQIDNIRRAAEAGDGEEVVRLLNTFIPEFQVAAAAARKARHERPRERSEAV